MSRRASTHYESKWKRKIEFMAEFQFHTNYIQQQKTKRN